MGVKTGIYYFTWYNAQRWAEAPVPSSPAVRARKVGRCAAMVRYRTVRSGWQR